MSGDSCQENVTETVQMWIDVMAEVGMEEWQDWMQTDKTRLCGTDPSVASELTQAKERRARADCPWPSSEDKYAIAVRLECIRLVSEMFDVDDPLPIAARYARFVMTGEVVSS